METRPPRLLLSLAMFASFCAIPALATPSVCVPASAAVYAQLSEGCTVGIFTLKNVAWSSVSGPGFVPVSAESVTVSPFFNGSQVRVDVFSNDFHVEGLNRILALFDYTIDPPPPILDDLNLSLDAESPVAPGFARITANVCPGELFRNSCDTILPPLIVQHFGEGNANNILFNRVVFPRPVNLIDVRITIQLDANGASSQIDGFGTGTTASPEPSTLALMLGAAGLAFGWKRRS